METVSLQVATEPAVGSQEILLSLFFDQGGIVLS